MILLQRKINGKSADSEIFATRMKFCGSVFPRPDSVRGIYPEKNDNII
jgi:hypothetical protein